MDNIDVHDLPEEKAEIVNEIVELFRLEQRKNTKKRGEPQEIVFLSRPMGAVRGNVTRKDIYDF